MIPRTILAIGLALASLTPATFAQSSKWSGTCEAFFSGKSTLHAFDGSVKAKPFVVTVIGIDDPATAKVSGKVTVDAAKMDTGNGKRDAKMHESMDVTNHPTIVADVGALTMAAMQPVEENGVPRPTVLPFTLFLKGKEHQVRGTVANWSYKDDSASFEVSFALSLKAAGIKPPSVVGVVKVQDEIRVTARVNLARQ